MTATLPPHSPHYSHHPAYNTNSTSYSVNTSLPNGSSSRLAPSYSFPNNSSASLPRANTSDSRQPPQSNNMANSQSTSTLQGARKRERRPDWHEFYKNGMPKEIIVIDDDSPQPPLRRENERVPQQQSQATLRGGEHASKKRRTGQTTAYDAARDQQAFSHARTYSNGNSGSNTISTDRTTSLQTTAPTSLGSHSSHGTASGAYAEDGVVGQKRKRVTRQQIADEKKRKEIEVVGDAYSAYVPPPKPPIKARDVHVAAIKDVRHLLCE